MVASEATEDRPSQLRIYLVVIAASTLHLSTGAVTGWSSPILPKLNLTETEKGLVTSLTSIGAAPGPFIAAFSLDTIGRKGTLFVVWIFYLVSWGLMLMSQNVYVIYIARIIGGLGTGAAMGGVPVYASEMAMAANRGPVGAASNLMIPAGALIMFWVGPYVNYLTISIYGLAMAAFSGVLLFFVPESPFYYTLKNKKAEAEIALQKVRGYRTQERLEEELEEIKNTVFEKKDNAIGCWEGMKHPAAFKAIGLGFFLTSMAHFSGMNVQGAYAETIYSSINLSYPASYMGIVNVICAIVFSSLPILFVNKLIRMKTCFIISGFGTGLACVFLGIYFYVISSGVDLYDYSYLALVLSVFNTFTHCIGMGSFLWTMVAELMPMSIKGIGMGIVVCISSLLSFGILAIFPVVAKYYGYSTDFFGCAIIMLIFSITAIFILPDTTGKTLQEIEELLSKKN